MGTRRPTQQVGPAPSDELIQELRLHREAIEKAAHEAGRHHSREQAMSGFRQIVAATRTSSDLVERENQEKARRREAEAKRIAEGRYFIDEAANAIAQQRGLGELWSLWAPKFIDRMVKAAEARELIVRDPSTWLPIPQGQRISLACIVTRADVNAWLDSQVAGYQWEGAQKSSAGTQSKLTADQRTAIGRKLARGDAVTALAREYGVSRRTIDKCKPAPTVTPAAWPGQVTKKRAR